jgi:hypothetical protein
MNWKETAMGPGNQQQRTVNLPARLHDELLEIARREECQLDEAAVKVFLQGIQTYPINVSDALETKGAAIGPATEGP